MRAAGPAILVLLLVVAAAGPAGAAPAQPPVELWAEFPLRADADPASAKVEQIPPSVPGSRLQSGSVERPPPTWFFVSLGLMVGCAAAACVAIMAALYAGVMREWSRWGR